MAKVEGSNPFIRLDQNSPASAAVGLSLLHDEPLPFPLGNMRAHFVAGVRTAVTASRSTCWPATQSRRCCGPSLRHSTRPSAALDIGYLRVDAQMNGLDALNRLDGLWPDDDYYGGFRPSSRAAGVLQRRRGLARL
jgi:hypothetical protein